MTEQIESRTRASRGPVVNTVIIIFCQSMQALAFGAIALFLPLIRHDVGISFSQAGTLAAVTTLTYAIMQIPAGYLADRFNPKLMFTVGLLGVNLLSLSFAVLHDYGLLLVNQAASGILRSLVFAPGMLLILRQFRPERKATAMGLYVAGGFSSNILLNILGPILVGPLGWRGLMITFSISALIVLGLFALIGDSVPRVKGTVPPRIADLRPLLSHRVVWLAGFIQFVRLAVVTGTAFWFPSLIVADKGFSLGVAGAVVAVAAAVTAPSNFLGGWLSDRLNRPLSIIGISLTMLAITLAIIPFVHSLVMLIIVMSVNAVFIQLYFGPLFAVPLQRLGAANAGLLSGWGNFCANLGGFAFTYGLGLIKEWTGSFNIGLWILAGFCVAGLGATWLVSRIPTTTETPAHTNDPDKMPITVAADGRAPAEPTNPA